MTTAAPFTAHRVIRAMTKTCAAHEIGLDGFALVALVGHQWDSIRYRRPVQYRIATLMGLMALTSKQSFYRIEDRCLKAGWLKKKNQGTRRPVLYWVAIPEHAQEAGDGPTEDGGEEDIGATAAPFSGTNPETNSGTNLGTNTGLKPVPKRDSNRYLNGTRNGTPSSLSPLPIPIPEETRDELFAPETTTTAAPEETIPFWLMAGGKDPQRSAADRQGYRELIAQHPITRSVGEQLWHALKRQVYLSELVAAVAEASSTEPGRARPDATPLVLTPKQLAEEAVHDLGGWDKARRHLPAWAQTMVTDHNRMLDAIDSSDEVADALIAARTNIGPAKATT